MPRNIVAMLFAVLTLAAAPGTVCAVEPETPMLVTKGITSVMKHFSKVVPPAKPGPSGSSLGAEITISYPELRSSEGPHAGVEGINAYLLKTLLSADGEEKPPTSVDQLMKDFISDFETDRKENPESIGGWSRRFEAKIRHADADLVCIEITDSLFTGGAHPTTNVIYSVFSLKTGIPVKLEEFVQPAKISQITTLGEKVFRKTRGMKPAESFTEAGFSFDQDGFALNRNFLMTKEGLSFFYNAYEVAPYSMGPTEVVIPWTELKNVITPGSFASRFLIP